MQQYVTNPQVIHETIDGETIIIDLASGTYFSLQGAAPTIWNSLAAGESEEQIVGRLHSLYAAEEEELQASLAPFLEQLLRDQLIAPADSPLPAKPVVGAAEGSERVAFVAPKLERFEDMQDIILLDPVHKVDNHGWPHAAPAASESA